MENKNGVQVVADLGDGVILKGDHTAISSVLNHFENGRFSIEVDASLTVNLHSEVETEKWWSNAEYYSESKNALVNVVDMDNVYLANAIVKLTRFGTGSMLNPHRPAPFTRETLLEAMEDCEFRAMICELATRYEEDEN